MNTAIDFWHNVDSSTVDQCWPWTGGHDSNGYGMLNFQGKVTRAHRVAWELSNGPLSKGQHVLHTCDNPPCVNPKHLFIGNQKSNVADCVAKGRFVGGGRARAKLTPEKIDTMILLLYQGETEAVVAAKFNVHQSTVSRVLNRKRWKHLK